MSEPNVIRNDSPHQVSMPEGTNVATGKKANASEPSVRKVLANADKTVNEVLVDEQRVLAPETGATESAEEQPSLDRKIKEDHALAPTAVDAEHETEEAILQRTQNDHMALLPDTLAEQSEVAFVPDGSPTNSADQGPLIQHSESDHFVALPETLPEADAASGPLIKRSEQDRLVALPDPVSKTMTRDSTPVPAEDSGVTELAQPVNAEAEALELSDTMLTMMQMDFPARVVKLKIENDKVRTKLDALQNSALR
ncbi:MAG: hypothetical protein Q7U05_15535 [Polaromonas sp.]|jgi:hypothetical protein|nr:hypothetical protein [Polaromonas sp.]